LRSATAVQRGAGLQDRMPEWLNAKRDEGDDGDTGEDYRESE
jgi:hypothetical protein